MAEPRIRLLPPEEPDLQSARMPSTRARCWRSPFEGDGARPAVSLFVTPRAFVRFCAHAGSDLENEVGGVLIGRPRRDTASGETFVVVQAVLPARHTRQGTSYLTFTQDSLVALNDEAEARFPGRRIVGWYHTHPRMGVFLSGFDQWLHRHFFPEPWQVALVIEPHTPAGGFFIREPDGAVDAHRYFGFSELLGRGRRSVVHWRNLAQDGASEPVQGG